MIVGGIAPLHIGIKAVISSAALILLLQTGFGLVIGNNDKKTLTLSLYYAKSLSGQYGNPWELIFPAVLLCIIPIVIIFIILQKNIIEGISAGAVKG